MVGAIELSRASYRKMIQNLVWATGYNLVAIPVAAGVLVRGASTCRWMTVDIEQARANGLTLTHEGREYGFCGKGCLLEFRDDPWRFLDPAYHPEM